MKAQKWNLPGSPVKTEKINSPEELTELFYNLAEGFSEILGKEVIVNDNAVPIEIKGSSTNIYYSARGGFELNIEVKADYYDDLLDEERTAIRICWLSVEPKGKGIGSKIAHHFLKEVSKTTFTKVVLDARDNRAAWFWKKIGFHHDIDDLTSNLDMYTRLPFYKLP